MRAQACLSLKNFLSCHFIWSAFRAEMHINSLSQFSSLPLAFPLFSHLFSSPQSFLFLSMVIPWFEPDVRFFSRIFGVCFIYLWFSLFLPIVSWRFPFPLRFLRSWRVPCFPYQGSIHLIQVLHSPSKSLLIKQWNSPWYPGPESCIFLVIPKWSPRKREDTKRWEYSEK